MSCATIGAVISSVAVSLARNQSKLEFLGRVNMNQPRRLKPVLGEITKTVPLLTEVVGRK